MWRACPPQPAGGSTAGDEHLRPYFYLTKLAHHRHDDGGVVACASLRQPQRADMPCVIGGLDRPKVLKAPICLVLSGNKPGELNSTAPEIHCGGPGRHHYRRRCVDRWFCGGAVDQDMHRAVPSVRDDSAGTTLTLVPPQRCHRLQPRRSRH